MEIERISITEKISYIKASDNPLSADVILIEGQEYLYVFDVGNNGQVEQLPEHTYSKLQLSAIILLEAGSEIIMQNLNIRDGKEYSIQQIEEILNTERNCAEHIAKNLNIPLFVHNMKFSNEDIEESYLFLKEVYGENFIGH